MIQRQTSISGNIVHLCKFLRSKGFTTGTREQSDAMRMLTHLPMSDPSIFKNGLRSIFSKNKWQYEQFSDLYEEFWFQLNKAVDSKTKDLPKDDSREKNENSDEPSFENLKSWLFHEETADIKEISTYSSIEVLTRKNFSDMSSDEIRLMMTLLKRIARQFAHQKSRLKKKIEKKHPT